MQIAPEEVQRRLSQQEPPVILDVRQPQETQAEGVIEGALLIPLDQLPARAGELPRGRAIIAVCKRGMRSFNAANWLKQAAGIDALSMSGGMDQWRALGLPIKR